MISYFKTDQENRAYRFTGKKSVENDSHIQFNEELKGANGRENDEEDKKSLKEFESF